MADEPHQNSAGGAEVPETAYRNGVAIPAESGILHSAYQRSGLTHGELAVATGMSVGSVRIALAGFRHRAGEAQSVRPPDDTLAKLAAVLGVEPRILRLVGRDNAAGMIEEVDVTPIDLDAPAAIAGRRALMQQVLAVFSTEELRSEITRRDATGEDLEP
ncbi:helix-turn-helix transcriptional regulator [Brachybacterium sp. sponge]|uniref:helix-turn-helix domain-containing protein n=1 Tax=Brachybacterium sp. sponge TaxID=1775432 RepID=UPI0007A4885D|nr:helix-turn-helix transcriptional regulator [Brachybacterium sp. sponge]